MRKSGHRTPRRLTKLFQSIRKDTFGVNTEEMADILNGVVRYNEGNPLIEFKGQTIKNLEARRIEATYIHIESYGNLFGLPAGMFLLISRFQHETPENIENQVKAFSEVMLKVVEHRGFVSQKHLRLLADEIGNSSELSQQFPPVIRAPGNRAPLSRLDRLHEMKREHDRNKTDPLYDLELWKPVKKED